MTLMGFNPWWVNSSDADSRFDAFLRAAFLVRDAAGGFFKKGERRMPKTHFNIQDQFLNQTRKAKIEVELLLASGERLHGYIRSFDSFCVIVENDDDIILIYKHAVSMIKPSKPGIKIPGLV